MHACNISPYRVVGVLSHVMEGSSEKPVAFAPQSLSPAEKDMLNYVDKEALAIILAETKFHQYLYGQNITIISDHKSLKHMLNENGMKLCVA